MVISTIPINFRAKNLFYKKPYSWLEKNNEAELEKFNEAFEPLENSFGKDHTLAKNIFLECCSTLESKFDKKWVRKLYLDKENKYTDEYKNLFEINGFDEENVQCILGESIDNAYRAATWSQHNIALGKKSSRFALLSLFTGILKQIFFSNDSEIASSDSSNLPRNDVDGDEARQWRPLAFSIINSFFRSQRNLNQYTMYSLPDDDAAMNVYQADVYGNKVAGSLARASTFMERNINPYLMPISEILPSNVGECFRKLAVIPTSLWWRARMPAYINQEFFTDFLKYMVHKPLALFGVGNSREEVLGIKERGNLKWSYFKERHLKNLGMCHSEQSGESNNVSRSFANAQDDVKSCSSLARRFVGTLEQCFNKDPTIQMESSKRLGEFLAPVLGMYGFFSSAVGNTSSALFRLLNIENKMSALSNIIQTSSLFSQQLIYLPKIIIPFYSETRQIENILNSLKDSYKSEPYTLSGTLETPSRTSEAWVYGSQTKDVSPCNETNEKQKVKELKTLVRDRKITSYAGMFGFCLHGANVILKCCKDLPWQVSYFNKLQSVLDESACGLTNYFFSSRRYAMGEQFRIENPEFYEAN
jgi:hypothetical protein